MKSNTNKFLERIENIELKKPWKRRVKPIYTGDIFGELTVIGKSNKKSYLKCQCSCGRVKEYTIASLRNGAVKTCGHGKKAFKKKIHPSNPTGVKGVTVKGGKYMATITDKRKTVKLGTFNSLAKASTIRKIAELNLEEDYMESTQDKFPPIDYEKGVLVVRGDDENTGIYHSKTQGKWDANITVDGIMYGLGTYANKSDAINIRRMAEDILISKSKEVKN